MKIVSLPQYFTLFSLVLFSVSTFTYADEKALPTPLDIELALTFAKDHPRTHLSPAQQLIVPRRQPLFLNCHDLTFNNTDTVDNLRNYSPSHLISPEAQQKMVIMQFFFDVLLADSSMIGINEDMAGAYIAFNRAQTRQKYKQYSELKVARLEANYQKVRQQSFSGAALQRLTRSQLAQAINHPNDLSSELNPPTLITLPKKLPELDDVLRQALNNNTWIKTLKKKLTADQAKLVDMNLKQELLELLLRSKVLKAAQERSESATYRRDLDLELSRALYEMEVKSSLGRSMTLQSKARMEEERIAYCQTLAWARLNALRGLDILTPPQENKKEASND